MMFFVGIIIGVLLVIMPLIIMEEELNMDKYDECWFSGEYTEQDCKRCPYNDMCSGNEDCDNDD